MISAGLDDRLSSLGRIKRPPFSIYTTVEPVCWTVIPLKPEKGWEIGGSGDRGGGRGGGVGV